MKTALITGASGGIGYELARLFAENNHHLVLVARNAGKLQELKELINKDHQVTVTVFPADLSVVNSPQQLFNELEIQNIKVDILVNNAGFGTFGLFAESDWNKELEMIQLNITALTHLTRLFLPHMISQGSGKILNVASTAAFQPGPLMSVYFATKAYVLSFSEAIANELKGTGVTVTTLCPGATESGFQQAAKMENSRLFNSRKIPGAKAVAKYGYNAMMKGKTVAVHGGLNKFLAFSVRLSPRKVVTAIVRKMQEEI